MAEVWLPEKLYLGFYGRKTDKSHCFAYLTYYEKNAAFEKRKKTIDYNISHGDWADKCQYIDNSPLYGYRMHNTTSGGLQKSRATWSVLDPRGFLQDITNDNLLEILDYATLDKREILDQCIWGWNGAPYLLVEGSPSYEAAMDALRRRRTRVSLKEVKPGCKVELSNGVIATYLGLFYSSMFGRIRHQVTAHSPFMVQIEPKNREYYFYTDSDENGKSCLFKRASIRVSSIIEQKTISDAEREEQANALLFSADKVDWYEDIFALSVDPLDTNKIELTKEAADDVLEASRYAYFEENGKGYLSNGRVNHSVYAYDNKLTTYEIDANKFWREKLIVPTITIEEYTSWRGEKEKRATTKNIDANTVTGYHIKAKWSSSLGKFYELYL